MEADIVVEGFKHAETMHGVRYMFLIGDGDSSVLTSIQQSVPGWGRYVRKIECVNHVLKNYRSKLEDSEGKSLIQRSRSTNSQNKSGDW